MTYLISAAAEKAGVSQHTIRYYEKIGLLPRLERTNNCLLNYRAIDDQDIARIKRIKWYQQLGLLLSEIKLLLAYEEEEDGEPGEKILTLLQNKRNSLVQERQAVDRRIEQLELLCTELDY